MVFFEELRANNIDPVKFIEMQNEFISYSRKQLAADSKSISYREHLERDQILTMAEKFINRLERELLQERIRNMTS